MAGYFIGIDGEEHAVDEQTYRALTERALVQYCDECSSEFSGTCVAHPVNATAEVTVESVVLGGPRA